MSAASATAPSGRRGAAAVPGAPLVLAGGLVFLLVRPDVVMASPRLALALLAGGYAVLWMASVRTGTAEPRRAQASPVLVLALGLGTVAAAALAWRRAGPVAVTPWGVALNAAAAVSEEAFFRRFLYGRLAAGGAAVAVLGSALAFALIHVPLYGTAAFPLDLGAGLLLSWQRWASGTWAVPAATHVAANLLAVIR
jgi:membrane protease YdiL (CAAX protease family)